MRALVLAIVVQAGCSLLITEKSAPAPDGGAEVADDSDSAAGTDASAPIALIDRALRHRGLSVPLVGATPSLGNPRGGEIDAWLKAALHGTNNENQIAILDDDADMTPWMSCLVQTDDKVGIQDEDVELAIYLLTQGPSPLWKPDWSPGIRRLER